MEILKMADRGAIVLQSARRHSRGAHAIRSATILVLASFLFYGSLVEIGVRIIQPVGSEHQPQFAMEDQAGWTSAPNQSGFVYQRNYAAPEIFKTKFRTNSFGMPDREYPIVKGDHLRILAVGDSFTEEWGVEESEAYPKVLEQNFLQGAEVWNLGVVG
jgi:hypothetical protein